VRYVEIFHAGNQIQRHCGDFTDVLQAWRNDPT
jgi:hypothetical protein